MKKNNFNPKKRKIIDFFIGFLTPIIFLPALQLLILISPIVIIILIIKKKWYILIGLASLYFLGAIIAIIFTPYILGL